MTRIHTEWSDLPDFDEKPTAVTWGVFDGIHRGHQRIIDHTVDLAERNGWSSLLMTFRRHPEEVLRGEGPGFLLSLERRREFIEKRDIDHLLEVEFDLDFAGLEPSEFYRNILRNRFHAGGVVLGREARFGKDRKGDTDTLRREGASDGLEVVDVDHARHGGKRISSTRIRRAVTDGRIQEARAMLGRPPEIEGTVTKGEGRGRELGFPTANLQLMNDISPPPGIYGGVARIEKKDSIKQNGHTSPASFCFPAVASIGYRPTFSQNEQRVYEVHILQFDRDIYDRRMQFFFLSFIREERDFDTVDKLIAHMEQDIEKFRLSSAFPEDPRSVIS